MSILKTVLGGAFAAAVLLAAPGCEVDSKHPLSDEKTSTADLGLVGDWREEGEATKVAWRVVKHPKSDKVLMAFMPDADLDDPDLLFTTTIGGKKYLSWGWRNPEARKSDFLIYRYALSDEDTVRLEPLSKEAIRKAITDARLSGKIVVETSKKTNAVGLERREKVRLTAETKDLRAFLEAEGDGCFRTDGDGVLVYRRVK